MPLWCKNLLDPWWEKLSSSGSISREVPGDNNVDHTHTVNISRDRDDVVKDYDAMLWEAKISARTSAFFHKLTRFMGICAITWSTVVLLGGFASDLPCFDFYIVVIFLILEVGRFGCTLFFTQLVRKNLVHNSQNPRHLNYKDIHQEIVSLLRCLSPLGQFIFLLPALGLPLWRYLVSPSGFADLKKPNLIISMPLFYLLVLCNAALVVVAALISAYHHSRFFSASNRCSDGFIQRYFDEVIWRALHFGLAEADDFDIFKFAFSMQARDYRCNVQPLVVRKVYGGFFEYLLAHRMGLHILSNYLESNDCFEQRAAANIVGFWCTDIKNNNLKQYISCLSTTFLHNLFHKMETCGQIGWDAANSLTLLVPTFKILSREDGTNYMEKLVNLTSSDKKDMVEFLTSKLDPKRSWSISYLRLLAALLHNINDRELITLKMGSQVDRVTKILESDKSRPRAKMYAAYALLKAEKSPNPNSINGILRGGENKNYFLVQEVYMLDQIRKSSKETKPLGVNDWKGFEMKGEVKPPFCFWDETAKEPSSSIELLRNNNRTTSPNTSTSSPTSGVLTKFYYRVMLAYKYSWVGGVHDPKDIKNA